MNKGINEKIEKFHLRAQLPRYFRYAAVALLGVTAIAIIIAFYRSSGDPDFRMKGFPTSLSKDVIAVVNGYERREMEGDVVKYYIKADKGTTFSDNHQELENVYLEVFDPSGLSDKITAAKAVYVPEKESKNFTGYFAGAVNIETRDSLKVRTEQVTYRKADEVATADEAIEFQRDTVKGKAFGAVVKIAEKKLELQRDVEIETFGSAELASSNVKQASVKAQYAVYDQMAETIELRGEVETHVVAAAGTADAKAERAIAFLAAKDGGSRDLKKLELHDNVSIVANRSGEGPVDIRSGSATYDRIADRFDLHNGARIETAANGKHTILTSATAIYQQGPRKIDIDGNAEITHGAEFIKGDHIYAELHAGNKLKYSNVRGNAYLRQTGTERTTEVSAGEMKATFDENQQLQSAAAFTDSRAILTPVNTAEYSKVVMAAPKAIRLAFKGEGLLENMITEGRTTIDVQVLNSAPDSANKRVTADTVRTFFHDSGKDIRRTEAIGNAELFVEPLTAAPENYRTTVNAPRFDCEFFPTGNNARECVAPGRARTTRVPTVASPDRGEQTVTADKMTVVFDARSKDAERLDATGNAKFKELDRNAIADQLSFTKADETVRLRGGEPAVWDSRARARAPEIDWDTKAQKSYLRGGANTTYYSQKSTGGATPFGATDKPVFLTADTAEFDHRNETAFYSGNARGWQEKNYVRGDKLWIQQREGQLVVEGNVQSQLNGVRRKDAGRDTTTPAHVSARRMTYNRDARVVRYENDVDIRQGTDRIVGSTANIYLDERNEITRGDVEGNVIITQPRRKAVGDYAQYIAASESVVLRGNPARVEDAENGASSGGQMTVFLRDNRVLSEGRSAQNSTGRIRSVYKVKTN